MGRGRQKAKNTKVARELKYFSPNTDLSALEKELAVAPANTGEPDYEDKWADLYEDELDTEENVEEGSAAAGEAEDDVDPESESESDEEN
ncbi:unannotated protein [freshwater metagenome]|uniref:Unannotated protein n=1 Tax=freshwater metagenome TaxID=449393 RepID=A0A6J7JQ42_9ZZZZ|nr:DUF3073 family protein [Actinomycetota bacterium]